MVQVSWVKTFVLDFQQLIERGLTFRFDSNWSSKPCSKMGLRLKTLFISTLFIIQKKQPLKMNLGRSTQQGLLLAQCGRKAANTR